MSLNRLSLVARFNAREWTVRESGFSASTFSNVCATFSLSSPGRPTIRSMLMLSNPRERAMRNFSSISSTVWWRPIRSSVSWFMVCGLIEIRVTGNLRMAFKTSSLIVSGRPASTVNSCTCSIGKSSVTFVSRRSICAAFSVVGVPPPM